MGERYLLLDDGYSVLSMLKEGSPSDFDACRRSKRLLGNCDFGCVVVELED